MSSEFNLLLRNRGASNREWW